LEEISFTASDCTADDNKIIINKEFVEKNLSDLASDEDLSRFIL